MWTDKSLVLCDNEDFFGAAGTVYLGDVIDWEAAEALRAAGMPMGFVVQVATKMTGGTSIQFVLRTGTSLVSSGANAGDLSVGDSVVVLKTEVAQLAAVLAGRKYFTYLPFTSFYTAYLRYMQLQVVRVGTSTAGKVNAYLTLDPPHWVSTEAAPVPL